MRNVGVKKRGFLEVKKAYRTTDGDIVLPQRSTKSSAGYDFYSPVDFTIPAYGYSSLIFTDVKAYMQEDEVLQLYVRSSLGVKKGLVLANGTGIIDSDYFENEDNDGNIGIKFYNCSNKEAVIHKGDRIVQGIFSNYLITDNDNVSTVRVGGVGSSGI